MNDASDARTQKRLTQALFLLALGLAAGLLIRAALRDGPRMSGQDHQGNHRESGTDATAGGRAAPGALPSGRLVDLRNETCPIMDSKVPEGSPAFLIWDGYLVRFCCPGCDVDFLEAPLEHLADLAASGAAIPEGALDPERHPPLLDARNSRCPVTGDAIPDAAAAPFAVHRGVRISFCCADCLSRFAEDPDRFLAEAAGSGAVPPERLR